MNSAHSDMRSNVRQRGFTVLIAALIASVVLSLGSAIFSIAQKQITLASIGRDSQYAFYTADTASECALYWDVRYQEFDPTPAVGAPSPVVCDGQTLTIGGDTVDPVNPTYPYVKTFTVNFFSGTGKSYCADVTITKNNTSPHTVIKANGYSASCAVVQGAGSALQRTVELRY